MRASIALLALFLAVPVTGAKLGTLAKNESFTKPPKGDCEGSLTAVSSHEAWVTVYDPLFDFAVFWGITNGQLRGPEWIEELICETGLQSMSLDYEAHLTCKTDRLYIFPCEGQGSWTATTAATATGSFKFNENAIYLATPSVKKLVCY